MKAFLFMLIFSAIVVLSISLPQLMLNPGQLSQGHQKIEEKCTSCHKLFSGINDARCISCHELDQIGKDSSAIDKNQLQFHAGLKGQRCTSCHTDHKGIDPALSTMNFNHNLLSATLLATCNSCHTTPRDSLHPQLPVTCGSCHNTEKWEFSGIFDHDLITGINKTNCVSCHKKPEDALHLAIENNCVDCHSVLKWSPATFEHSTYFVLDKDHNAKCVTCHTNSNNFKIYTCYGCHEHSEAKIIREHKEEGVYNIGDCASCHRSGDKHDIRSRGREGNDQSNERVRKYIESEMKRENSNGRHDKDD